LRVTARKKGQFQANPKDTTPINGLTKEDLSGDLLYAGILSYFASVDGWFDKTIVLPNVNAS